MRIISILCITLSIIFLVNTKAFALSGEPLLRLNGRYNWSCAEVYNTYLRALRDEKPEYNNAREAIAHAQKMLTAPYYLTKALDAQKKHSHYPTKFFAALAKPIVPAIIFPFTTVGGIAGFLGIPFIAAEEGVSQILWQERMLEKISRTSLLMNDIKHYEKHKIIRKDLKFFLSAAEISIETLVHAYNKRMLCPSEINHTNEKIYTEFQLLTLNEIAYILG